MNELVAVEGIFGTTSVDTNMVEASSSKPKLKGKGGKKKKDFSKLCITCSLDEHLNAQQSNVSLVARFCDGYGWLIFCHSYLYHSFW